MAQTSLVVLDMGGRDKINIYFEIKMIGLCSGLNEMDER